MGRKRNSRDGERNSQEGWAESPAREGRLPMPEEVVINPTKGGIFRRLHFAGRAGRGWALTTKFSMVVGQSCPRHASLTPSACSVCQVALFWLQPTWFFPVPPTRFLSEVGPVERHRFRHRSGHLSGGIRCMVCRRPVQHEVFLDWTPARQSILLERSRVFCSGGCRPIYFNLQPFAPNISYAYTWRTCIYPHISRGLEIPGFLEQNSDVLLKEKGQIVW